MTTNKTFQQIKWGAWRPARASTRVAEPSPWGADFDDTRTNVRVFMDAASSWLERGDESEYRRCLRSAERARVALSLVGLGYAIRVAAAGGRPSSWQEAIWNADDGGRP